MYKCTSACASSGSIGVLSNQLAIAVGFFLGPVLVHSGDDVPFYLLVSMHKIGLTRSGIWEFLSLRLMSQVEAVFCVGVFALVLIGFRSDPMPVSIALVDTNEYATLPDVESSLDAELLPESTLCAILPK